MARPCPCGSGRAFDVCCRPLHQGALATTVEQLMRSRYSAYAVGDLDHVYRTWHPRTRPAELVQDPLLTWVSLEVLDATGTEVEFLACFTRAGRPGALDERSRFERRAGRWLYVDGDDLGADAARGRFSCRGPE